MTEKEFFDLMIKEYAVKTGEKVPSSGIGHYLEYFMNGYPPEKLELKLTRKIAARLLHEFMLNILGFFDEEWKEAGKLKDIYDCRVCANAIAQVYDRGIMPQAREQVFGLNETVTAAEAEEYIKKMLDMAI